MKTRLLFFLLLAAIPLHAKDYSLIEKLPQRITEAKTQAHKGWDSGVTPVMQEATYHYNDALVAIIKDMAHTFYPKGFLTEKEINAYLAALYTMHRFKQNAANPTGEFQGTVSYLEAPANVGADLEDVISDMVQAIVTDDPKFDYTRWKKKWEQARQK
jgi:hypothetical protein